MGFSTSKTEGRRLLVINFVTDANDPILGFAVDWINELAKSVDQLVVLTGHMGEAPLPSNVKVVCTGWQEYQNIRNVLRFLRQLVRVLQSFKPNTAFTHMALVQGFLAAPVLRLFRIRHTLWYVHRKNSVLLRICHMLSEQIVTSSVENFPIQSPKVSAIGHGIRSGRTKAPASKNTMVEFVHWGRCDPIKRIDYLTDVVRHVNSQCNEQYVLRVIGDPSSTEANTYWLSVVQTDLSSAAPVLRWEHARPFGRISESLNDSMVFLHACESGLDKAPLEASMMGFPVLSENPSVRKALGDSGSSESLVSQIEAFLSMSASQRQSFAEFQRAAVVAQHSIDTLGERLCPVLFPCAMS